MQKVFLKHKIIIFTIFLFLVFPLYSQDGYQYDQYSAEDILIYYSDTEDISSICNYISHTWEAALWENEEYRDELLNRLYMWAEGEFYNRIQLPDVFDFLKTIDNANYEYLFEKQDGSIAYDEEGDPVLKTATDLEEDKELWNAMVEDRLAQIITEWESSSNVVYDELLAGFREEIIKSVLYRLALLCE